MPNAAHLTPARSHPLLPYQLYRQQRAGHYVLEFSTESAAEAVQAFLKMAPAFEGGAIRLWSRRESRVCASVFWVLEKSGIGFFVRTRSNVFHDATLARIAEQTSRHSQIIVPFKPAV